MFTRRKSVLTCCIIVIVVLHLSTPFFFSWSGEEIADQRMRRSITYNLEIEDFLSLSDDYSSNVEWEKAAPLVKNDTGHAHAYNGKIYFVGGSTVQEYDPTLDMWTIINNQGIGYMPYRGGSALIDDTIYMVHGWTAEKTTIYDITANEFSSFPTADYNRLDVAVAQLNGIVYVSGGWSSGNGNPTLTVRACNPQNDSWFPVEPLKRARKGHEMVTSMGYLYAIGGALGFSPVERYDPQLKQWEEFGNGPAYSEFGATIIQGGDIFVAGLGGESTKVYDFRHNTWFQGPFNSKSNSAHGANSLVYLDGYVYSVGARDSPGNYYGDVWKVKSTIPPFINHPSDMRITEDSLGPITLVWSPVDNNPASYNLTQNGDLIKQKSWDGEVVYVNIDDLTGGNYTFVCTVIDEDGNTATDIADVEILFSPNKAIITWDFNIIMLSQIVVLAVLKRNTLRKKG